MKNTRRKFPRKSMLLAAAAVLAFAAIGICFKGNTKNDYVVNIEKSVERPRDQMITGKRKCDYTLPNDTDDGLELSDNLIGISGTGMLGHTYTMDSFALTPSGLKIFGTSYPDTNTAPEEAAYPVKTATLRILARDDLGNQYLMYPRYPSGDGIHAVYELYADPTDPDGSYLDEWSPDAAYVTVCLQQEVLTWIDKTEFIADYPMISDTFTIDLTQTAHQ